MSAPVDVLAVLDGTIEGYEAALPRLRGKQRDECEDGLSDLKDARAAVAELIALGKKLEAGMIRPSDENRQQVYTFQREDAEAFFAALARVRGAA